MKNVKPLGSEFVLSFIQAVDAEKDPIPCKFLGVCPEGYTTAGADCDDIDECVANNGHGPCQDVCVNTDGGFKCACDVRFCII